MSFETDSKADIAEVARANPFLPTYGYHGPAKPCSSRWSLGLGDKDWNLTFRARLIFGVWRVCTDGQHP